MTSGCIRLTPSFLSLHSLYGPRKQTNIAAETMFPRMILVYANDLETTFPCRVTQQTFHWKQTLAHTQLRKLRAYVTIELRKRRNNGCRNKMFLKKIRNFFRFPETKDVSATNVSFTETFTETCFLVSSFAAAFKLACNGHMQSLRHEPCCFICLSTLFLARIPTFFTKTQTSFELLT